MIARRSDAEITPPLSSPNAPISIRAAQGSRWYEGEYEVWSLEGDCTIVQGNVTGKSQSAVVWINRSDSSPDELHKVIAYIYGYNHYAQQSVIGLGFTQEGLLREHIYFPKQGFLDIYLNGITASDFRANRRLSRLSQRLVGWDITIKPTPPEILSEEQIAQAKEPLRKILFGNRE